MFLHFSEETHDNFLRSGTTLCAECGQYASFRLVERVYTGTVNWILKFRNRNNLLICGACHKAFKIRPRNRGDLEHADMHSLLLMSSGRYVEWGPRLALFFAVVLLPVPVMNVGMAWVAWLCRAHYPPGMLKVMRFTLGASIAVMTAMIASILIK